MDIKQRLQNLLSVTSVLEEKINSLYDGLLIFENMSKEFINVVLNVRDVNNFNKYVSILRSLIIIIIIIILYVFEIIDS